MTQLLVLCTLMAVVFVQMAQAQLGIPLPTIPPITIPPITIPPLPIGGLLPVVPAVTVCPAGYFADLTSCYPCPRGSTSTAGVTCFICPTDTYAPGAGSAQCYPCAKGLYSTPAGEACLPEGMCPSGKSSKVGGKRSLREEIEEEAEADSVFSF
jgi:hypothetical protein